MTPLRAVRAITATTLVATLFCGALIHVVDRKEFPTLGSGMWWAVQTVTTVGYGDLVPNAVAGRIVAVWVMLAAISFLTVATAGFSARLINGEREAGLQRLEALCERLERVEALTERKAA